MRRYMYIYIYYLLVPCAQKNTLLFIVNNNMHVGGESLLLRGLNCDIINMVIYIRIIYPQKTQVFHSGCQFYLITNRFNPQHTPKEYCQIHVYTLPPQFNIFCFITVISIGTKSVLKRTNKPRHLSTVCSDIGSVVWVFRLIAKNCSVCRNRHSRSLLAI